MEIPPRRSPVHEQVRIRHASIMKLGLHDYSTELIKLGLKGPGAQEWLGRQDLPWPEPVYACATVDAGILVVRIASDEVVLEASCRDERIESLESKLTERPRGVYRVEQQNVTLIVKGPHASRLWAQTCGVPVVDEPPDRIIYTRVAGVSCGIIPERISATTTYRVWVDYSYAPALWDTFVAILDK